MVPWQLRNEEVSFEQQELSVIVVPAADRIDSWRPRHLFDSLRGITGITKQTERLIR